MCYIFKSLFSVGGAGVGISVSARLFYLCYYISVVSVVVHYLSLLVISDHTLELSYNVCLLVWYL